MSIFLITFVCFAVVIAAMAIGAMMTGRQIKGSCGGLNNLVTDESGKKSCGFCGMPAEEIKKKGTCAEENPEQDKETPGS